MVLDEIEDYGSHFTFQRTLYYINCKYWSADTFILLHEDNVHLILLLYKITLNIKAILAHLKLKHFCPVVKYVALHANKLYF